MNWRTTNWLLLLAVILGGFVLLIERPARLARLRASAPIPALRGFDPGSIVSIDVANASNQVSLRRTNGTWEVTAPARFTAQATRIETLLRQAAGLEAISLLTASELEARPEAASEFGLNPPATTVIFASANGRAELRLGSGTLSGDQVYFQVAGLPGIFVSDRILADLVPAEAQGWRDTTVVPVEQLQFDRVRVAAGGSAFTLARMAPNVWELVEPRPARADAERIRSLLRQLSLVQAVQFLPASGAPAPEVSGLQPPRAMLTFARGSNDVFQIAFGAAVSNAPIVYAQRAGESEVLTVPASALDLLRVPYKNLLDRRILRFDRAQVREVEVQSGQSFTLVANGDAWRLGPGATNAAADPELVSRFLGQLQALEIVDIEKEVVTSVDLPNYGLAPPVLRIALRATPGDTNSTLAVLETGALLEGRLFARVAGEQPVYVLPPSDVQELPQAGWQLRDRGLWRFTASQVASIAVTQDGLEWTLRRVGTNDWAVPAGWKNEVNPFALDDALLRLSEARAVSIVGEGDQSRLVTTNSPLVTLVFRGNPAPAPLQFGFGKRSPAGHRYAAVQSAEGQRLTIELPGAIHEALWKEIGIGDPTKPGP